MNLPLRVVIVVTHLLGVGHLARAGTLARAMAARGHQVRLVTGGQPVPLSAAGGPIARAGVEIVQLPPVHVTGTAFSDLRQADGAPLDAAAAGARIAMATQAVRDFAPHVLVTELFPFGRRALGEEFLAVIAAARALPQPPLALASVRDILARPSQQAKIDAAHARLRQFYDGVLVHSDPAVARLEASWPLAPDLQPLLHYTGYVDAPGAAAAPAPAGARAGVVVSGGGSEAALPLLRAALQAAALDAGRRWRLLAGHKIPETDFGALQAAAPANVTVERARPDFRALLAGCAVSVSQFGYNTALDLLASGAPAVVVPFAEGGETEQAARAALFAARGRVTVLAQEALTPPALLAAVNEAASRPAPQAADIAVDGATRTARIIEMLAARRAPAVARLAAPMRAALRPAAEALARAADAGAPVAFWWRDDDAATPTPRLERLLRCAGAHGAPLAIAAIPARATADLAQRLAEEPAATLLPHGLSHDNLAPPEAKKGELSHGAPGAVAARAAEGLALLRRLAPALTRAVLVPPWNRVSPAALPLLAQAGFAGVSTFAERSQREAAPGLAQVNAHVDPVNWRGDRSLVDPGRLAETLVAAIARRATAAAAWRLGPVGLLTHHLVHDDAVDAWMHECVAMIAASPGGRFVAIDAEIAG